MANNHNIPKTCITKPLKISWLKWTMLCATCLMFLIGCQTNKGSLTQFDSSFDLSNDHDQIILLHGMLITIVAECILLR